MMKRTSTSALLTIAVVVCSFATLSAEEPPAPEESNRETIQERARKWLQQYGQARKPSIYQKNHSKVLESFKDVVADVRQSTVKILVDGKQKALGVIADADGLVLTKASELSGDIECELLDGSKKPAELIGVSSSHDLGMLRVNAKNLKAIDWKNAVSQPAVGSWLATVGQTELPVSIGVVSVAPRKIGSPSGVLGIMLEDDANGVRINQVLPGSGAEKAGLHVNDIVKFVNGKRVNGREELINFVRQFKPGDRLRILVQRGDESKTFTPTLGNRESLAKNNRANFQNTLGGALSRRRTGFDSAMQHDTVLRPIDCGGPVVDLTGNMVGLNIARAGRVNSYALPFSVIAPLIADFKAGKFSTDLATQRQLDALNSSIALLKKSEGELTAKVKEMAELLKKSETEFKKSQDAVAKANELLKAAQKKVEDARKQADDARRQLAVAKAELRSAEAEKTSLGGDEQEDDE